MLANIGNGYKNPDNFFKYGLDEFEAAEALAMLLSVARNDSHFVMWFENEDALWVGPVTPPHIDVNSGLTSMSVVYVQGTYGYLDEACGGRDRAAFKAALKEKARKKRNGTSRPSSTKEKRNERPSK